MVAHIWMLLMIPQLFLSCVVSHYLFPSFAALIFWLHDGSTSSSSRPKVKHLTNDQCTLLSHAVWSRQTKSSHPLFLYFSAVAVSKVCSSNITTFQSCMQCSLKRIMIISGPIYYFTWLLMILCTRPTQLITFSMNNK